MCKGPGTPSHTTTTRPLGGTRARSAGPWPLCPALLCSALSLLCCAVAFPLPLIFCAWAVLCRAVLVLCCHRRAGGVFFSSFFLCSSPSSPRVANNCLCHSAIRAPILGVLCPAISFFSVVSFVFVSFPPSSLLRANSFLCQTAIPDSKICVWLAANFVWRQFSVSSEYLHVLSKLFFLFSYGQTLFVACDIFSCIVFLLSVV